jgi:hypothetical protein
MFLGVADEQISAGCLEHLNYSLAGLRKLINAWANAPQPGTGPFSPKRDQPRI